MSFVTSPVLNRWLKEGKSWQLIYQPFVVPLPIPPNTHLQMPQPTPVTFQAEEGTLLNFGACFDNPICGIRLETSQGLDSGETISVVNALTIGVQPQGLPITVAVPPVSAPGHFCINVGKEWTWKGWCRIYLFNPDAVTHNCILLAYVMAVLNRVSL